MKRWFWLINMALSYFRQLYSLDTLDTRFVVPATAPPKEALEEAEVDPANPLPVPDGKDKSRSGSDHAQPSRWRTNEFYFYYLSISASVFFMFKLVLGCSKGQFTSVSRLPNITSTQHHPEVQTNGSAESHPNFSKFSHLLSDGWIPGRKVVSMLVITCAYLLTTPRTIRMHSIQAFGRTFPISLL